jgi:uncharacterized protein (DUF58 family)
MSTNVEPPTASDERLLSQRPWYFIAVVLIICSLVFHQPLLVVAGLLVAALGFIPELWYRFSLRGLVVSRELSEHRAMFGDSIAVALRIENRKLLPLPWLEVDDEYPGGLPLSGGRLVPSVKPERLELRSVVSLWLYQRLTRRYTVRCVARGIYAFGPLTLRTGDPFGFLERDARVDDVTHLIVYPLTVPLERLGLPPRQPFGERTAPRRLLEDPLRTVGVRPYMPGDEPRRIHWKATAHTGAVQSKVYEPATRHTLALFVDVRTLDQSVYGYDPALFELALCAAASVIAWGLDEGYAVGLFANGTLATQAGYAERAASATFQATSLPGYDGLGAGVERGVAVGARALRLRVPPSSDRSQLPRALAALARLYPYLGAPIERTLDVEAPALPFGATVVYIGAARALGQSGVAALERLRARGAAVTLLLTDDAPLEAGRLTLHRLGGKETWDALEATALAGSTPGPLPIH